MLGVTMLALVVGGSAARSAGG